MKSDNQQSTVLQVVRQEIKTAFSTHEISRSNDDTAANYQVKSKTNNLLNYDKDGWIVGERQTVRAVSSRAKGTSSCPLPDDAFIHSRIVREVNQLPDHLNDILLYCYTDNKNNWEIIQRLSFMLWHQLEVFIDAWERCETSSRRLKAEPGKKIKAVKMAPSKIKKLKALVFNAILHYRTSVVSNEKLYTVDTLSQLMSISSANWRRDWAPFWNQLLKHLFTLDKLALEVVERRSRSMVSNAS